MVQVEGSSPVGDIYEFFFSSDFYFSFVRPMDFSDIVILCITPSSCCQQNFTRFDMPLLSSGLFS